MNTFLLVGADHYVSHWDSNGYPDDIRIRVGTLVNSEQNLPALFTGKFVRVDYDDTALNIDGLYNPPDLPIGGGCGNGSDVDLSDYYTKLQIDTKLNDITDMIGLTVNLVQELEHAQGVP
jgi:hypothetical protein